MVTNRNVEKCSRIFMWSEPKRQFICGDRLAWLDTVRLWVGLICTQYDWNLESRAATDASLQSCIPAARKWLHVDAYLRKGIVNTLKPSECTSTVVYWIARTYLSLVLHSHFSRRGISWNLLRLQGADHHTQRNSLGQQRWVQKSMEH